MTRKPSQATPTNGRGGAWTLVRQVADMIDKGKYAPGARLPTYRELGEKLGLSSGVVSYGMSILAKQGYVERRHGSGVFVRAAGGPSMGSQKQAALYALVVPDIESGLYLSIQAGMESSVQASRAQLITMTTGGSATRQADALMQLVDRNVAGIALVPSYEGQEGYQLRHLLRAKFPLVLLHRGVPDVSVPVIDIPFAEVGFMAGKAIAERGHKRAGAIFGLRSPLIEQYLDGYRRGLTLKGAKLSEEWVSWSDSMIIAPEDHARQRESVEEIIVRLRESKDRPTAIFVSFDRLAVMVYFAALKQGLRVPEDLSIVSFGASPMLDVTPLRMAAVTVDEYRTGQQAHQLLLEMHTGSRAIDEAERFKMEVAFDTGETLIAPGRRRELQPRAAARKRRRRR